MVSLQPNTMSTGAQYMDEVIDAGAPTNNDIEPILASTDNGNFKKLRTIPVFSIHLFVSTVISVVSIALTAIWPKDKHTEAYYIITNLRVAFWLLTFLFDHLIRKHHNELLMNGYHDFHRSITRYNGVALNIVSAWNTFLLLTQFLDNNSIWSNKITPIASLLALQVSETVILQIAHGMYISAVYKFNSNAHSPDAIRGTNMSAGSLGLMQPGGNVTELLEMQAVLIAYLKDHNQKLSQRLHQLTMERNY